MRTIQVQTRQAGTDNSFSLPSRLDAREPPETQGLRRDQVRLLVYERESDRLTHSRFDRLPEFLRRGDVLVLNDSRTIPSSLRGYAGNNMLAARLLYSVGNLWFSSITPNDAVADGSEIVFDGGLKAWLRNYDSQTGLGGLEFDAVASRVLDEVYKTGSPIQYEHLHGAWPLDYFQTVYAIHPGSVEMPSAGRPFTWELLFKLQRSGVHLAFITLHCALSYLNSKAQSQLPMREQYFVSNESAETINRAKDGCRRVIAVGTTVVRALESAIESDRVLHPGGGWTDLRIHAGDRLRIVDGLLTGFHEPDSSHLEMISAFIGPRKLRRLYREAIRESYHWHEFGDANLII